MSKSARSSHFIRGAVAVAMASAATMFLPACGGGNECPSPLFTIPVTATWAPPSTTGTGYSNVVVRWSASTSDALPERYYEPTSSGSPPDAGRSPVSRVTRTAARELTFEIVGLDDYLRTRAQVVERLRFPDPMAFTSCSHPGRGDEYVVDVTLTFDTNARSVTASFGEPHLVAGGCNVTSQPANGGGANTLAVIVCGLAIARARRRRLLALRG